MKQRVSRILLISAAAASLAPIAAVIRSDHTMIIVGHLYVLGLLLWPFFVGGLFLFSPLATAPVSSRWRVALGTIAGYLLIAGYIGVAAYLILPAHYLVGMDQSRGIMEPLWEMHGEEMAYAEQYRETAPLRYQAMQQRVLEDRLAYLGYWLMLTLSGLVIVLGALLWYSGSGGAPRLDAGRVEQI